MEENTNENKINQENLIVQTNIVRTTQPDKVENKQDDSLLTTIKNKMNFWQDGMSIDESKISILVVCFICVLTFGLSMYFFRGDISENLTSIITAFIYAIAGVNITNGGISSITNKIGNFLGGSNNKNN